jgi:hypothetical protein
LNLTTINQELTIESSGIMVYPNPVGTELFIESQDPRIKNQDIKIYDLNGKIVFVHGSLFLSPRTTIDVSQLTSGTYFLKIGETVVKFVKE